MMERDRRLTGSVRGQSVMLTTQHTLFYIIANDTKPTQSNSLNLLHPLNLPPTGNAQSTTLKYSLANASFLSAYGIWRSQDRLRGDYDILCKSEKQTTQYIIVLDRRAISLSPNLLLGIMLKRDEES